MGYFKHISLVCTSEGLLMFRINPNALVSNANEPTIQLLSQMGSQGFRDLSVNWNVYCAAVIGYDNLVQKSSEPISQLAEHDEKLTGVILDKQKNLLITTSEYGIVRSWNINTKMVQNELFCAPLDINGIELIGDQLVLYLSHNLLRFVDASSFNTLRDIEIPVSKAIIYEREQFTYKKNFGGGLRVLNDIGLLVAYIKNSVFLYRYDTGSLILHKEFKIEDTEASYYEIQTLSLDDSSRIMAVVLREELLRGGKESEEANEQPKKHFSSYTP
eukprot:CAMPEP_0117434268 /NCGR_PEP_ID=MMETSP0758-20121206/13548_1 /TAXON_ID=63605 /ORGANISM="Percolomonas cosmopolitus, Strain AE-1 (ATCC 50343)" /LENGTH=272 /DNA_ID=CAMNT_0005225599 /DNA_START=2319 /DNA_END=3133 /DNA_ORIENTATION=+